MAGFAINLYTNWRYVKELLAGNRYGGLGWPHLYSEVPEVSFVRLDKNDFRFSLYDERRYYAIKNAVFTSGNAGNSLYFNINNGFSTPDSDHDKSVKYNCAQYLKSGWWFR